MAIHQEPLQTGTRGPLPRQHVPVLHCLLRIVDEICNHATMHTIPTGHVCVSIHNRIKPQPFASGHERNGRPHGSLVKKPNAPRCHRWQMPVHHRLVVVRCAQGLLFGLSLFSFYTLVLAGPSVPLNPASADHLFLPSHALSLFVPSHFNPVSFVAATGLRTWLRCPSNHRRHGVQRKCTQRSTNPIHSPPNKHHRPRQGCLKSIPKLRPGRTERRPRCKRKPWKSIPISVARW